MTKEEMEQLKMETEMELLKLKLQKEQKEAKPSRLSTFFDRFHKWIALLVAIVSLGAGVWGLVIPAKNYFDERQKQVHYDLSKEMIGFANKLNDTSKAVRQDAVMLLSYYDLNSMPILLFKLETLDNDSEEDEKLIANVIKSISLIYMRNHKAVTDEIIHYFRNIYKQSNSKEKWNRTKYSSLKNFGELINKIEFRKDDSRKISEMITYMKDDMAEKDEFRDRMTVFNNLLNEFEEYYKD